MKTRERTGISKFAIPVVLIVVIVVVARAYVLATRRSATSSTSQTSSTNSLPAVQVQTVVNQLVQIQSINDSDVDGLLNFYNQGAVVTWSGPADGLVGSSSGGGNIRLLYAASIGKTTTTSANMSNYAQHVISPTTINATWCS